MLWCWPTCWPHGVTGRGWAPSSNGCGDPASLTSKPPPTRCPASRPYPPGSVTWLRPCSAVQALREHRRQQARLRLAGHQPPTVEGRWVGPGRPGRPVGLHLVHRTERGTALNPNHASRGFAHLASSVGLDAHPYMLRHALASAMAANKEPASIIAAQLRHADGGALAQRVYIHQLPQTAPRVAGLIEGVFGPAGAVARSVSAERRAERRWSESGRWPTPRMLRALVAQPGGW